jgi:4-hydroxybenzoate polyprenyltransferase
MRRWIGRREIGFPLCQKLGPIGSGTISASHHSLNRHPLKRHPHWFATPMNYDWEINMEPRYRNTLGKQIMVWFKLLRIANLPSALANILVGFLLANQSWQPTTPLVLLLVASACLYCAGMVLNDLFDIETDREQRSSRPLVSGAISVRSASIAGYGLLIAGVIFAALAGLAAGQTALSNVSLGIAVLLALSVWSYDGPLKKTIVAPVVMGLCRTLNILLGASTAAAIPGIAVWYAVAIGVFVCGITLVARREADAEKVSLTLWPGTATMVVGLLLAMFVTSAPGSADKIDSKFGEYFSLLIAILALPILRRCVMALVEATPSAVQIAVITSLRSLIVLDAAICLLVENGRPVYSIALLGLLGASFLLGRLSKVT